MRLSEMNDSRGNIVIVMIMAVPAMISMLMLVVEAGQILLERARLEAAVDRAAYAGAASMADTQNRIAADNWRIHKAWRDLDGDFRRNTQQNDEKRKQALDTYAARYAEAANNIGAEQNEMAARAEDAALGVLEANASGAEGMIAGRADAPVSEDENAKQKRSVKYGQVEGTLFTDPNSVKEGSYVRTKYLVKPKGPDAVIGVSSTQRIKPIFFGGLFPNGIDVYADSAAQVFGGSIEDFARKETDTLDEAEAQILRDGYDALYHAAIVPIWTLGAAGRAARH